MSEIVRVGAIGKNPAIDKINQLNEVDMKNYAVSKMEAILLNGNLPDQEYGTSIPIDFSKVNWAETVKPENKEISEKFPYAIKPQEVYMDKTGQKIVTLNLLENTIEESQVDIATKEIQRIIRQIYPESIYHSARCIKITEGTAGWFSFLSGGILEEQLHIMFILPFMRQ